MLILGLDIPSSSTGWACYNTDKRLSFSTGIMPCEGKGQARLLSFRDNLRILFKFCEPTHIAIEAVPVMQSAGVAKMLSQFNGIAQSECYDYLKKDSRLYIPGEWRKLIGVAGNAKKFQTAIWIDMMFENTDQGYRELQSQWEQALLVVKSKDKKAIKAFNKQFFKNNSYKSDQWDAMGLALALGKEMKESN